MQKLIRLSGLGPEPSGLEELNKYLANGWEFSRDFYRAPDVVDVLIGQKTDATGVQADNKIKPPKRTYTLDGRIQKNWT